MRPEILIQVRERPLTLIVRKLYFDLNCFCHLRTHRWLPTLKCIFIMIHTFNIFLLLANTESKTNKTKTNLKSQTSVWKSYIKTSEIALNIIRSPQTDTSDYIYVEKNSLNYTCTIAGTELWIPKLLMWNQIAIKIGKI